MAEEAEKASKRKLVSSSVARLTAAAEVNFAKGIVVRQLLEAVFYLLVPKKSSTVIEDALKLDA